MTDFLAAVEPAHIAMFLLIVNVWTYFRYWQDKASAAAGGWRVPESDLLALAVIGGTPAAYLARHVLRHKTRKQPFANRLFTIFVIQLAALAGLAVYVA